MPSTVVASFTYDIPKARLQVTYVSGNIYDYLNVPEDVYEQMKALDSKGSFLNTQVKGKYAYKKVK